MVINIIAADVIMKVVINYPSSTKTVTQKKDKTTITMTRVLHLLVNKNKYSSSSPPNYLVEKIEITL